MSPSSKPTPLLARALAVVFALGATAWLVVNAQRNANGGGNDPPAREAAQESPGEHVGHDGLAEAGTSAGEGAPASHVVEPPPAEEDPTFLFSSKNASISSDADPFLRSSKSMVVTDVLPEDEEEDEITDEDIFLSPSKSLAPAQIAPTNDDN